MLTQVSKPKYMLCTLTTQASRHLISYYDRALAPFGITAHQMMALGALAYEDNITLGVFAQRAGIGKASAVTMIKRIEAIGLVETKQNPDDARLNVISLSKKARDLIPEIFSRVEKLEKALEKAISVSRLKDLVASLEVIKNLEIE